jgi:hypothetical protein
VGETQDLTVPADPKDPGQLAATVDQTLALLFKRNFGKTETWKNYVYGAFYDV